MLSVTADGWAFLRLPRPDVGIHCLTIFLCDWAYTGEFSATLATIVTLKATILHFIAKVLTQVKVSVWHILALGLTWLFSLFSNLWHICSVCGWISASLNVDVLVHRTFSYTAAGHVCSNLVFGTGRIVLGNRNPDFLQFIPSPQTRLNRCDAQKGAMQSSFSHHFHSYLPGKERSRV